jgi:hypothetical protein
MRYLVCLVLGLLIGAVCAITAANILARRDAYPKGLMTVMQHALKAANATAGKPECVNGDPNLGKLALLSADIQTALPGDGTPDRVFDKYVGDLQQATASALASTCSERSEALTGVKNSCDACHRDYR